MKTCQYPGSCFWATDARHNVPNHSNNFAFWVKDILKLDNEHKRTHPLTSSPSGPTISLTRFLFTLCCHASFLWMFLAASAPRTTRHKVQFRRLTCLRLNHASRYRCFRCVSDVSLIQYFTGPYAVFLAVVVIQMPRSWLSNVDSESWADPFSVC